MNTSSASIRADSRNEPIAGLVRVSAAAFTALLGLAAVVFGWRRLAGAMHTPLSPQSLFVVWVLLVGMATAARANWRSIRATARSRDTLARVLASVFLLAPAAAVTLPGSNGAAMTIFWIAILGQQCWTWRDRIQTIAHRGHPSAGGGCLTVGGDSVGDRMTVGGDSVGDVCGCESPWRSTGHPATVEEEDPVHHPGSSLPQTSPTESPPTVLPMEAELDEEASEDQAELDADMLQQLTLSRTADGTQRIEGWLRMPVAAGQRTGNLHVAFCPPFAESPLVEAEQLDGPACRIKTALVLPHGARLDIKLAVAADEPQSVLVRFAAAAKG